MVVPYCIRSLTSSCVSTGTNIHKWNVKARTHLGPTRRACTYLCALWKKGTDEVQHMSTSILLHVEVSKAKLEAPQENLHSSGAHSTRALRDSSSWFQMFLSLQGCVREEKFWWGCARYLHIELGEIHRDVWWRGCVSHMRWPRTLWKTIHDDN